MIEVISGTNRPECNALKVAQLLRGMYQTRGVEVGIVNLQEMPPALFSPAAYATKPAAFQPMVDRVLAADGLHVVVPEYNGSFPGVLKYFIDMLPFPESFEQRCVTFTGEAAGMWGALRAVEQLQAIFGYRNALIAPERVWIARINQQWDDGGTALADASLTARLEAQVEAFAAFVERNKGGAAHQAS